MNHSASQTSRPQPQQQTDAGIRPGILLNHRSCAIRAVVIDNEQLIPDLRAFEIQTHTIKQRSNVCSFVKRRYDQTKFVGHGFFLPTCRQLRQPAALGWPWPIKRLYEKYLMQSAVVTVG
jgi:hypothetical protein